MAGLSEVRAIGPSYQLADRKAAVQRTVNYYLSPIEGAGEDRPAILKTVPGMSLVLSLASTIEDAEIGRYGDRIFVASGGASAHLYEVNNGGVLGAVTDLGVLSGSGPWSMCAGTGTLVIVAPDGGSVFNIGTSTLTAITDADFGGATTVVNVDGYFICNSPGTEQFFISANDDGLTWDALDFSSADVRPDNIITLRAHKRELHLLGSESVEIWVNSGSTDFPFVRQNSTPIDIGVLGRRAAVATTDSLFFGGRTAGGRGFVFQLQGYTPVRVSTVAVEEGIAAATDLSALAMWTYHDKGAEFVGLWAPGMSTTWVYDLATKQWHERALVDADGDYVPQQIVSVQVGYGEYVALVGDSANTSAICKLDAALNTVALPSGTSNLPRERTWPHLVAPSAEPIRYDSLELLCTTGYGGQVSLEISNDGGYTWGSPLTRTLGATGRRMQPVRWNFLGQARDRVFRIRCSDDVPLNIHGAQVAARVS